MEEEKTGRRGRALSPGEISFLRRFIVNRDKSKKNRERIAKPHSKCARSRTSYRILLKRFAEIETGCVPYVMNLNSVFGNYRAQFPRYMGENGWVLENDNVTRTRSN